MTRERFSFEGLETIERRIVRLGSDVAYLQVQDRTIPRQDETVGRFDFTMDRALPYLAEADLDDTDLADWGATLDADEPPTPEQIAKAACRWIRDLAKRCTVGEAWRRFRVKTMGPKGDRMLDSGQFVCRNHHADLDLPAELGPPEATEALHLDLDQETLRGVAKGMKALGVYYAQWGQLMLGSVGQLQGIHNQTTVQLHRQLQESRAQVDQLVGSILEYRAQQATADEVRHAEQRDTEARTALARDALHQIGEAARALLSSNGLPAELAEVVAALGQSPALLEALRGCLTKCVSELSG